MRITRSTLRRLIAEESARLLREAAFPEEIEAQYGRGRGGEEEEEERGTRMLHVTYHGGAYEGGEGFSNVHYIVTDYDANPMGEEAEDVTAEITGGEDLSALEDALALRDWLLSHTEVGYVVNEEMHDPETDENDTADEYLVYLDGVISAEEAEAFGDKGGEMHKRAVDRGEHGDLDEADKKGRVSPRKALGRYLASHGADDEAVFRAIDRAIDRAHEDTGEMPTSEDITFNLSDEILDAIPEDDSDKWHSMLEDVLADEFDADAFADAEAYRKDIEDTERDLSHPSRFLEEGEGDSDPDGGYVGFMASDEEMDYLRGGGSHSDRPYADLDVPDNRYTRGRAKGFNREPRVRGDDIDSGYDDDIMGDDSLSEGEGDSDSDDQFDPDADDLEAMSDRERQRLSAYSFWGDEPGSSLKASHSDFDAHRGADMGVRRFITRGRQGKPHRVSADGRDIDSGDEDLNESIDMVSAGIGAVVGVASLYAVGGLASVAKQVLNALSDRQQDAALDAAHRNVQSKMAAAVEALSEDEHLIGLFKQLRSIQRSKRDGMARDFTEKTQEINEYIRSKSEELDFGGMDTQGMRSAVHKRLKKGDRKKSDDEKLDESRWAKLAGILKG